MPHRRKQAEKSSSNKLQWKIYPILYLEPVWPDWAIRWILGRFLKLLATINLPKSPTFVGNFCKGVKIYHLIVKSFWATNLEILWFFSGHTVQSIRIYKKLCYFNRNQSECFHFSKVFFTALTNYSDKFTLSFLWSILIYKKLS